MDKVSSAGYKVSYAKFIEKYIENNKGKCAVIVNRLLVSMRNF